MLNPVNTIETVQEVSSGTCFKAIDNCSNDVSRAKIQNKIDMINLAVDLVDTDSDGFCKQKHRKQKGSKSVTNQYSLSKLGDDYNVICQQKNTMTVSIKIGVESHLWQPLETLKKNCFEPIKRMLANRKETSSKFYPEIPCVVAKSLVRKYQANKKCKAVKNTVIPICGDKGRQIKIEQGGIRIPALFKKQIIPVQFHKQVIGHVLNAEFYKKKGKWYLTLQYNTVKLISKPFNSVIGIDRNSKGNVATCYNTATKEIKILGPDTQQLTQNYRNRRANLQSKQKFNACKKLSGKQQRRIYDINHKVSRNIVNSASETSSAIVLEDLSTINKGKASRYTKKSQWAFYQLDIFIRYKAALLGIPVFYVSPYNTSKQCSRCGSVNNPNGKQYKCCCGYFGNRDVNAAINIAERFYVANRDTSITLNAGSTRLSDNPQTGYIFHRENLL